ncbi:DMT family transporter [Candidatus Gracilibacteria bacterium]|nr:DMT family transporter [Candidatus Gracilibacteria bacterium]
MLGILLSISVAFLKALSELAGKIFVNPNSENAIDEYALSLGVRTAVIFPALAVCLYQGLNTDISSSLIIILLGALGNAITTVTALKAVKYGDLSLVGPLGSLTIPFLLVTSFLINRELPNIYGFVGVLIIFFGTYILAINSNTKNLLDPLKNIFSDLGARYMLLTTFIWSLTTPIDKLGVEALGAFHWLLYLNIFAAIFLFLYIKFSRKNINLGEIIEFRNIKKIGAIALFLGLGNVLQLLALKYTLVIYVISIKRASGVFSVLLGFLFFKEKNILYKTIASLLMLVGVACIILGGNI